MLLYELQGRPIALHNHPHVWIDVLLMLFGQTEKEQEGAGVRCQMGLCRKPSSDLIPLAQGDSHKSDLTCRMDEGWWLRWRYSGPDLEAS